MLKKAGQWVKDVGIALWDGLGGWKAVLIPVSTFTATATQLIKELAGKFGLHFLDNIHPTLVGVIAALVMTVILLAVHVVQMNKHVKEAHKKLVELREYGVGLRNDAFRISTSKSWMKVRLCIGNLKFINGI